MKTEGASHVLHDDDDEDEDEDEDEDDPRVELEKITKHLVNTSSG